MNNGFQLSCELINEPAIFLSNVKCERNPHSFGHVSQCCWYSCDEWRILDEQHKLVLNSKCEGERVILYSTSSTIWNEPWGQNAPNQFIFWKNRFYRMNKVEWVGEWTNHGYPLVDRPQKADVDSDNEMRPSYKDEHEDGSKSFMRMILRYPEERTNYLVFADWLGDHDIGFHEYIREALDALQEVSLASGVDARLLHYYRLRKSNIRTAIYTLVNLFQNAYSLANFENPRPAPSSQISFFFTGTNTGKVVECQGFYSHPLIYGHPLKDDE